MIGSMKRIFPIMLLMLLLVSGTGTAHASRLEVTVEENGKDLVLGRGDLLVVLLPANRTTGYGWKPSFSRSGVLKSEGDAVWLPAKGKPALVGASGTERWIFRAEKAGATTLALVYVRPWEHGKPAEKTVSWPVTVRP